MRRGQQASVELAFRVRNLDHALNAVGKLRRRQAPRPKDEQGGLLFVRSNESQSAPQRLPRLDGFGVGRGHTNAGELLNTTNPEDLHEL